MFVVALDPLATDTDLDARGITVPDSMDADAILAAASAAVRDAAGCPILTTTSTVDLVADDHCSLELPGWPVTAAASVAIEGVTVTPSALVNGCWTAGWRKSGNTVLFIGQRFELPATVTVVYTHGLAAVPADIIDLVCGLASMAFATGGDYGASARLQSTKLGDFAERFFPAPDGADSPSPMAIPEQVRRVLRARFGTSAATVRMR